MKRQDFDPDLDFIDLDNDSSDDDYAEEYYEDGYINDEYYEEDNYAEGINEQYSEDGNYEEYFEDNKYQAEYYEDGNFANDNTNVYYEDDDYPEEYTSQKTSKKTSKKSSKKEHSVVTNDYGEDEEENSNFIKGSNIILILFLIIIIGVIISIFVVLNHNSHNKETIDPNEGTVLEKEPLDMYKRFVPDTIEGYVDDGELNIMILSDDSMTDISDPEGIPALLQQSTGANVYSAILPGGVASCVEPNYNPDTHPEDAFSLFYQVLQICSGSDGDYGIMEEAFNNYMGNMEDAPKYRAYWDVLHKIPFKKADVIIVNYGTSDYIKGSKFHGTQVGEGLNTVFKDDGFETSIDHSLLMLKERFPFAQIIAVTPYAILVPNENGELVDAYSYNTGEGCLGDYVSYVATYAEKNSITLVDNYLGTDFDIDTVHKYVEDDGKSLTQEAKKLLADHIAEYLYFNYNSEHGVR